jgi:hypothetical protein
MRVQLTQVTFGRRGGLLQGKSIDSVFCGSEPLLANLAKTQK